MEDIKNLENQNPTPYDNLKAHDLLLKMMALGQKLTVTFDLDEYGAYVAIIESKQINKFKYQVSDGAIYFIINYIFEEGLGPATPEPLHPLMLEEGDPPVSFQLFMLMVNNGFTPQIVPSFIDRQGRVTAVFKGINGTIITKFEKTAEVEDFLNENEIVH